MTLLCYSSLLFMLSCESCLFRIFFVRILPSSHFFPSAISESSCFAFSLPTAVFQERLEVSVYTFYSSSPLCYSCCHVSLFCFAFSLSALYLAPISFPSVVSESSHFTFSLPMAAFQERLVLLVYILLFQSSLLFVLSYVSLVCFASSLSALYLAVRRVARRAA